MFGVESLHVDLCEDYGNVIRLFAGNTGGNRRVKEAKGVERS